MACPRSLSWSQRELGLQSLETLPWRTFSGRKQSPARYLPAPTVQNCQVEGAFTMSFLGCRSPTADPESLGHDASGLSGRGGGKAGLFCLGSLESAHVPRACRTQEACELCLPPPSSPGFQGLGFLREEGYASSPPLWP